jgi:cobalamin biosynthesis Mg chelatase CobN
LPWREVLLPRDTAFGDHTVATSRSSSRTVCVETLRAREARDWRQTAGGEVLTEDNIETMAREPFDQYVLRLYQYLQVVETRLFSEGLHVLGHAPTSSQLQQYLGAYFGDELHEAAVSA